MRRIDRNRVPAPASLTDPSAAVAQERAAASAFYQHVPDTTQPSPPKPVYVQYKNPDVSTALYTLFHGKCAYCEADVGAPNGEEIEHYRPKGRVAGVTGHTGYWWLASEWSNLLLSCTGCNQGRRQHIVTAATTEAEYLAMMSTKGGRTVGKQNQFPVGGVRGNGPGDDLAIEDPHLIDPTDRDPEPELVWSTASHYSIILPAAADGNQSRYGRATIDICALNRAKLVGSRTRLLNQLRFSRTRMLEDLEEDSSAAGVVRAMRAVEVLRAFAAPDQPFSAMAQSFIDSLAVELEAWLKACEPPSADLGTIENPAF